MILVADTSPLNYLVQIDHFDIVERLYGHVIIPEAVYRELTDLQSPHKVRTLLLGKPEWLEVRLLAGPLDPTLLYLGPGEQQAIQLAEQLRADAIPIDDKQGRAEAAKRFSPSLELSVFWRPLQKRDFSICEMPSNAFNTPISTFHLKSCKFS